MDQITPNNEELRNQWNNQADWYQDLVEVCTTSIFHTLIPVLDLNNPQKIAEAGCGTGNGSELMLKCSNENSQIWANDVSDRMIELANARQLQRLTALKASNDSLPYENDFFDLYVASLNLMLVPDASAMLREAHRVLKPSGKAVFSILGRREYSNMMNFLETSMAEVMGDNGKRSPFYLNDIELTKGLMSESGFTNICMFRSLVPFGPIGVSESMNFYKAFPPFKAMKNTDEISYEKLMEKIQEKVEIMDSKGEILSFDIIVLIGFKN